MVAAREYKKKYRPKVLLVEDDPGMIESISEYLELKDYKVKIAANGLIAVRFVKDFLPDIIVCDINMPKMDGYHFLRIVRSNAASQATPFVFLTGKSTIADMRKGMNEGADDYLMKPFRLESLADCIQARIKKHFKILQGLSHPDLRGLATVFDDSDKMAYENLHKLSPTQSTILQLVAKGHSSEMIGKELSIAIKTVENHRYAITKKLKLTKENYSLMKFAMKLESVDVKI